MSEEVIIKVKVPKEMKEQIEREIKIIVDERRRNPWNKYFGIFKGKKYVVRKEEVFKAEDVEMIMLKNLLIREK